MPASKVGQIAAELRQQILNGEFGTGRLPTGNELASRFNASRDTIQKVLTRLEAEGLLEAVGDRGTSIRQERVRIAGLTARFDLILKEQGFDVFEENKEDPKIVPAPLNVAQAMGVTEAAPVVRRYRLQGTIQKVPGPKKIAKTPYRLTENFYPTNLIDDEIFALMKSDERADVLKAIKDKHNQIIVRAHEDIVARLPTPEEEESLKIITYAPVIEVTRINYTKDDVVIMVNKIIFVANYFTFSYDYPVSHWGN